MSTQAESQVTPHITGETVYEAKFDPRLIGYSAWLISLFLAISVVGVLLIPFWLAVSGWYGREFLRRVSARVTTQAVEIRKGVFFRKEATIPLNRITDVRLHDDPLMRFFGLRGLKVETAGQSGPQGGSEGELVGVIDAVEMRNAILLQRQQILDPGGEPTASKAAPEESTHVLAEIRDILARIEERLQSRDG